MSSKIKQKLQLTDEDREMYAAERLDNFRWISHIVASYSMVHLTENDRVPRDLCEQISDIGRHEFIFPGTMHES